MKWNVYRWDGVLYRVSKHGTCVDVFCAPLSTWRPSCVKARFIRNASNASLVAKNVVFK